jgi:dihydrofolate reductase
MSLPLFLLAAIADNGVIGDDNRLIWQLSSDLKRFRQLTMGHPMLMGRKTFDSIGKALPGRETVVLTRDTRFAAENVHVAHDLESAVTLGQSLAQTMGASGVAVVGGAEIYALTLPLAQKLYLTEVHASPNGDAFFPQWDKRAFRLIAKQDHPAGPRDQYAFTFADYQRI